MIASEWVSELGWRHDGKHDEGNNINTIIIQFSIEDIESLVGNNRLFICSFRGSRGGARGKVGKCSKLCARQESEYLHIGT